MGASKSKPPPSTSEESPELAVAPPQFIYSFAKDTNYLYRTNLATRNQSRQKVIGCSFNPTSCWTELPGGSLLFTGVHGEQREVVRIESLRDYAVTRQPPLLTARGWHCAVYCNHYAYVVGGWNAADIKECERYVCAEERWEALAPLPKACCMTSGVAVQGSLYVLGGYSRDGYSDLIQQLSLTRLTWQVLQLRLPKASNCIPCFRHDDQVYLIINKTVYSFQPFHKLKEIIGLHGDIQSGYGPSYYSNGTLYCANKEGYAHRWQIGSLTN